MNATRARIFHHAALALVYALGSGSVAGQATVFFYNRAAGVLSAPVYGQEDSPGWPKSGNDPDGLPPGTTVYTSPRLEGPGYTAELWAAPGQDAPEAQLQPVRESQTGFRTGAAAGLFYPKTVTIPTVLPDAAVATLQVRVWDNRNGEVQDWNTARNMGCLQFGRSAAFNVFALGGVFNVPPVMEGLRSFSLTGPLSRPARIISPPQNQTIAVGRPVTFSVIAGGDCLQFQWFFNGVGIAGTPGGAVSSSITIPAVQPSDAGEYSVRVWSCSDCWTNEVRASAWLTVRLVDFLWTDSESQGNWIGRYGAQGQVIIGQATNCPAGITVTSDGHYPYWWATSTAEGRALQKGGGDTGRVAACWASYTNMTLNILPPRPGPSLVSLYFLDWDSTSRRQQVDVLDPKNGTILLSQVVSDFSAGKCLIWEVSGQMKIKITALESNAVVSGIFFDQPGPTPGVFTGINRAENGEVKLRLSGIPGLLYRLDGSSDLRNWTPISTNRNNYGSLLLTDTPAPAPDQRFYRAVIIP